ncbi:hypothetical protein KQX54_016115 [Cotesia glomerata]|uniref:Uncharacterized protein n=1 Tax=Cotesia glomerata TaxID=32391 RepID=A0AAV7IRB8_COTGL|nr:hypothetical protein KQX54_016115 [Cotesia glomerata]
MALSSRVTRYSHLHNAHSVIVITVYFRSPKLFLFLANAGNCHRNQAIQQPASGLLQRYMILITTMTLPERERLFRVGIVIVPRPIEQPSWSLT